MPPVLVIGDRAFANSRNPPDGRLDTLIFTIDAADFDGVTDNAEVSVGYLSSAARLPTPPTGSGSLGAANTRHTSPTIRPDQVGQTRQRLGTLHKGPMAVQP